MGETEKQPQEMTPVKEDAVEAPSTEAAPDEQDAELQARLDALTAERDDWKEKSLRLAAEMENLRKRASREMDDARKYAISGFAREVLTVADNLERAIASLHEHDVSQEPAKSILTGVELVAKQLEQVFEKMDIRRIQTDGEKLNPDLHQVMLEIEHETAEPGTIVQEMQAGYTLADRLLRPALVGTAKRPQGNGEPAEDKEKKAS